MKAFCALVGISQLWQCLAEECSDTLGSCAAKQASLMQFKSLSQKKQALSLETQGTVASKLAGFEKFTDELVAKYGQPVSTPPSQQVLAAVKQVLDFINGLGESMLVFHEGDVEKAGNFSGATHHCVAEHLSGQIVEEINALKTESDRLMGSHVDCRETAKVDCGSSCEPNGACVLYDNYRTNSQRTSPNPATLPECVSGAGTSSGESAFGDDYIQAAKETVKLADMEQCLEDTKKWLDPLYDLYSECQRVETDCASDVLKCDRTQTDFQAARSLYAVDSNLHCDNLKTCLEMDENDCELECPKIRIRSAARAADNETGLRLVCLLENLFGELLETNETTGSWFGPQPGEQARIDGLAACKQETYDVSDWAITCECGLQKETDSGYVCPTAPVSKPCDGLIPSQLFVVDMGETWVTVANTGNLDCEDIAVRGAQGVVDVINCE